MLSKYLPVLVLCAASSAFALALPPSRAQTPFLDPQPLLDSQFNAKPEHTGVLIAFKRNGEEHEATVQFALGQPLSGAMLHTDPFSGTQKAISSVKVLSVVDMSSLAPGSQEDLAHVKCSITPRFSVEERESAVAAGKVLGAWPAFGAQDGLVVLDRAESRWFLAGRGVEKLECW